MNKKTFISSFSEGQQPPWICPTCLAGNLHFIKNNFLHKEDFRSRKNSEEEDQFDPSRVTYVFSGLLRCTNDQCREIVSCSGTGTVEPIIFEDEFKQDYQDNFHAKYFEPPLRIINIPTSCPQEVSAPLEESFSMYFISPKATLNNVRIAIEQLLTKIGVKRYSLNKKRKRILLMLHDRIKLLPVKYDHLKDQMLAVKWIGNVGSHSHEDVSSDNVLDTYEMVENILQEIYSPKAKALNQRAKKINKKKGPVNSSTSHKKKRPTP